MNKSTKVLSEIQDYFKCNDSSKAVETITGIIKNLTIRNSTIGDEKNPNCKMTFVQVLKLLVVFPFFSIKNPKEYESSFLGKLFNLDSKIFYRFMNNENITWRKILYSINKQLIAKSEQDSNRNETHADNTKVLILDDTDLPKYGYKAEGLGKIFSHVHMKCVLGFKSLFLCYSDGKSHLILDNTIQAEKGKNPDKPQGMSKKHKDQQYSKKRDPKSETELRKNEMFESKITNSIQMIRKAIKNGIKFEYLLVDSWFPCAELLHFIKRSKHNLVGMIKMGKTKYLTSMGNISAPDIISRIEANQKKQSKSCRLTKVDKAIKHSRIIGYYYTTVDVQYDGIKAKIHFFKKKNESWNAIISTDVKLNAIDAFKLYSRRWIIEVAHKEMKSYLKLGKNQHIDFAGQIASISLCMIQYNILCFAKRITSYETIGGLFGHLKDQVIELTLAERIWGLILEVVNVIADTIDCDPFVLTEKICNGIPVLENLKKILSNFPSTSDTPEVA